jgi:4-amino-4-deoxy-L-arabinose transferase-like glycosyltransferase
MDNLPIKKTSRQRWVITAMLAALFLAALGIRLYDLTDLPNDFYMVRQYRSMLIARGMYYEHLDSAPEWQREAAVAQWQAEGLIEPPLLERLVALTYPLTGVQDWLGRLYSSLFWLAGGVAIWLLARDMSLRFGGVIAVAYFLFVPFAVTVSRAFLPDPLMVALMAWSVWALYRWEARRTWKAAILAGLFLGFTIFVKSVAVFPMLCAAVGLVLSRLSWKRIFLDKQTWAVAGLTAFPTILYYIYGLTTANLASQFGLRFFPSYWSDPSFYGRWIFMAAGFSGFAAMFGALTGILLYPSNRQRFIAIGLWVGYILFGFTFPYHFMTHDYYHLPLILVVTFGLLPLADFFVRRLWQSQKFLFRAACVALLLGAVGMKMWESRNSMAVANFREDRSYYQDLGNLIGHEPEIVQLSGDYGYRLAYFGWVNGTIWPGSSDTNLRLLAGQAAPDFAAEFAEYTAGKDLFVITSMDERNHQPNLRDYLAANYPVFAQGEGYLIYDLTP